MCVCLFVCICTMYIQVPTEDRRGFGVPWNWCHKGLWAAMWVLRMEADSSPRAEDTLHLQAIFPVPSQMCLIQNLFCLRAGLPG